MERRRAELKDGTNGRGWSSEEVGGKEWRRRGRRLGGKSIGRREEKGEQGQLERLR